MTIYAHIRRSRDKQDEASQRELISKWAERSGAHIDQIDSDAASGGTPWQQRGLAALLELAQPEDTIVFSEISRIARSTVGVLSFLEAALEKGVFIVAIDVGIKLDGSLGAQVVATAFGMAAQIERYLLRARTKAALDARKASGLPVGRQPGAVGKRNKLAGKEAEINSLLEKKISKAGIARLLGVSRQTLDTFLTMTKGIENEQHD
jgi:DNA invertase Pin-like site-specific DNA recombinase